MEINEPKVKIADNGTGSGKVKLYNSINYLFGPYEIKVKLDEQNKFIGITEIKINKNFMNFNQKMPKGFHDVNEFYEK